MSWLRPAAVAEFNVCGHGNVVDLSYVSYGSLFPKTDHIFQQIWTKCGMQPSHNLQMVMRQFL